jgi:hypothetical protein
LKSKQARNLISCWKRWRQRLLTPTVTLFNKYSSLYKASALSAQQLILGHDDYKDLLKFIGLGLEKRDEEDS